MSLFIEPGTTEIKVAGETIGVRILTGRERIAISREFIKIGEIIDGKDDDAELSQSDTLDIQDANFRILVMGLTIDPDTVNPMHWSELVAAVWKANTVNENDSKN